MPEPSDPDLLVLLGLRLRSFAPAEAVAETVGLGVDRRRSPARAR